MQDEKLDGVTETAAWTGFKPSWIYAQAEAGKIPHFKCGKYLKFRRSEVQAWLEAQRRGPRA